MTYTTPLYPITLANLKKVKNIVIGNPPAKLQLSQDVAYIQTLVECLNNPIPFTEDPQGSQDDIRVEVAHVFSSIAYGSEAALAGLLRAHALQALLHAISRLQLHDSNVLKAAFARALRSIAVAIAECVGPSQWGLKMEDSTLRGDATAALDYLFHPETLDVFLPLLVDNSVQTSISIAQLLGSTVRNLEHRAAISEWAPASERMTQIKSRRGWEKTSSISVGSIHRHGGWVTRSLGNFLQNKDLKLQEAALYALAALAKDNPSVSSQLAKPLPEPDGASTLSAALALTKVRSSEVQLAACLCAAHILRAVIINHASAVDDSAACTVMNVTTRILSLPTEEPINRMKACFVLYHLIIDDATLAHRAFEKGSLEKLATLLKSLTPNEVKPGMDESEPEVLCTLREAALMAVAAICLFDNDVRRAATDDLQLFPVISVSLAHSYVGVRYAACQCIRAISRTVAVLRTNLVDTGVGLAIFEVFQDKDEDRRVTSAALSAVCNIVNEFSPLRATYLEKGLMARLSAVLSMDDPTLTLNALWAIKNLLRKTSFDTKHDLMEQLGWSRLAGFLGAAEEGIQEQAFNILRNIADDEQGIELLFEQLGEGRLFGHLTSAMKSQSEDIVLQAACVVGNIANGTDSHQDLILSCPQILACMKDCLAESSTQIRRPVINCILELAKCRPSRKELAEAGIVSTLRHICDWNINGASVSPSSRGLRSHQLHSIMEDDGQIIELAKVALDRLVHPDIYGSPSRI